MSQNPEHAVHMFISSPKWGIQKGALWELDCFWSEPSETTELQVWHS